MVYRCPQLIALSLNYPPDQPIQLVVDFPSVPTVVDTEALLADWNGFQAKLMLRLADFDRANINYRLPVPGARVSGGLLQANAPIAGLKIQYRAGKASWRAHKGPIAVKGPVLLRTLSPNGRRVSRTVQVN